MTNKYKSYTLLVLFLGMGLIVAKTSLLFIVDPLQVFHKPWVRETYFIKGARFQAAGIINNSTFDSIILGSSMAANFSPNEASRIFGGHFVNISPYGTPLSERSIILGYALRKKNLKYAIISLDGFRPEGFRSVFAASNYDYLYNDNRFDDIKVYMNDKYFKYVYCETIFSNKSVICPATKPLETIAEWGSEIEQNKRFGGLNKWFEAENNRQIKEALKGITQSTYCIRNGCDEIREKPQMLIHAMANGASLFDRHILKWAEEYQETEFYLFFPPFSRMRYAMWVQETPQLFENYLETIRHIANQAETVSNLHVYGFDHLEFLDDISNYKDTLHFHPRFNSKMLHWMKNDKYKLSHKTIDQYTGRIKYLANNYDIITLGGKIKQYLANTSQ